MQNPLNSFHRSLNNGQNDPFYVRFVSTGKSKFGFQFGKGSYQIVKFCLVVPLDLLITLS